MYSAPDYFEERLALLAGSCCSRFPPVGSVGLDSQVGRQRPCLVRFEVVQRLIV